MKTLIADDELVSRKKMQQIMEAFGECEAVETGTAAVAAFEASLEKGTPFDLITLDIMMPDMDGLRTLLKIRDVEKKHALQTGSELEEVKIMMVTSHSKKEMVLGCAKAGSNNYVVKPFDKKIITQKIEAMGLLGLQKPGAY